MSLDYFKSKYLSIKNIPVFQNIFFLSITQIVNYIFPLITLKYLVQTLGVDNFGKIIFAQVFIGYFDAFVGYGFGISATRDIAQAGNNLNNRRTIFSNVMYAKFFLLILASIFFFILVFTVDKFYKDWFVYLTYWGVVLGSLLFPQWYFQGIQKMAYITIVNAMIKVFFLMLIFLLVNKPEDYIYIPTLYSLSYILPGIYAFRIVYKRIESFSAFDIKELFSVLKQAFPLFISSTLSLVLNGSAVFIMAFFVTDSVVGYYSGYDKLIRACLLLFVPITSALYPKISLLLIEDYNKAIKYLKKAALYSLIFAILVAICFNLFIDFVIPLIFTEEFLVYKKISYILSIWLIFSVLNNFIGVQYLTGIGKSKVYSIAFAVAGAVTILCICLLTSYFSFIGTAYAVLLGELVLTLLMLSYICMKK